MKYISSVYKEEILKKYEDISFLEQLKVQLALEELVGRKEKYINNPQIIQYIANKLDLKTDFVKKNTFYLDDLISNAYGDVYKRMHNARLDKNNKYKQCTLNYKILAQNNTHQYDWNILFNILTENVKYEDSIKKLLIKMINELMNQDYFCYTLAELVEKYKLELAAVEDKLFSYSLTLDNIVYIQLDLYIDGKFYYFAKSGEK